MNADEGERTARRRQREARRAHEEPLDEEDRFRLTYERRRVRRPRRVVEVGQSSQPYAGGGQSYEDFVAREPEPEPE